MKAHLLMVLTVSLAASADPAPEDAKGDQKKIQGTWKVVSIENRGEKDSDEDIKDFMVVITKDKLKFTRGGKAAGESTYKLDPSKKPKRIDFTQVKEGKPGQAAVEIYELAGDGL